ncbi:MAG: flagellar biosynthesis protein [Sphingomonadales bacterium]|nr:flagellar biosynthesis protein [Sphingomonadales bacterium]
MSRIWPGNQIAKAETVAGWGSFGSLARGSEGFRSLYTDDQGSRAWNLTHPGAPTAMPEEPIEEPQGPDPIEEAAQQAFVQGFQEGERMAREAVELDNAARETLAAALQLVARSGEGELAAMLSHAVTRLVVQIIGEVEIDEAMLRARCEAVAACIDAEEGRAVLEVNPDDLPLLAMEELDVALAPSADLPRGSVRLGTAEGWVEDGPDVRLDRLKALMDDMENRT